MIQPFTVDVPGGRLIGDRHPGKGSPLILVHGFGGSRRDWAPLLRALPDDLSWITYDLRGFGQSTGDAGTSFSHADDLRVLVDHLGLAQVDLCGMSLGGATALHCALDHPHRVRRLVLLSPLIVGWSWSETWITRWKAIGRAARSGDMATARDLWWQHPLFASTRASPAADGLRASIEAFHGEQWVRDDQRPELPDIDRLTTLRTPTLLLTGTQDLPDFRLIADAIEALGQLVTRVDHPGAGHMLNLEIPAAIGPRIASFLRSGS